MKNDTEEQREALSHQQKKEKVAVILLSNALVEPRAVVVEPRNAHVAHTAMLRTRRPALRRVSHRRLNDRVLVFGS